MQRKIRDYAYNKEHYFQFLNQVWMKFFPYIDNYI